MSTETQKRRAHSAVRAAVLAGLLPELGDCEAGCGRVAAHRHHPEYSRPLFVVGLCARCHRGVHAGIVQEPVTGRWYFGEQRFKKPKYEPVQAVAWTRADRALLLGVVGAALKLRPMPKGAAHVVAALEAEGVLPVQSGELARDVWARAHAAETVVLARLVAAPLRTAA